MEPQIGETEQFGAFVFLPGEDLNWEWWSVLEIRDYIQQRGVDDEGVLDGMKDLDFGEEFLVLVIERLDGQERQEAHFHRMNKVRLN